MGKASDNIFPKVQLSTAIASAAPSGGTWRMEARADGIYAVSSNTGSGGTGPFSAGSAGAVATDAIWDAAGDLVQGTGANTAARLALGAVGTVVRSTGATNAYAYPPGHEFDYAEFTAGVTISATTEATANTVVTSAAVTYDGSTAVVIEFFANDVIVGPAAATYSISIWLYDGASSIGQLGFYRRGVAVDTNSPTFLSRRLTPSAASHTYSIRASRGGANGSINAGAGGSGLVVPGFIRITKA